MAGPILWGPNNTSNNLQNQILQASGALLAWNGPKNYITYGNFENGSTTGWSLGTTGTLTNGLPTGTPTFGSGASGTLSLSVVSSGQLGGVYSLSYADSAASTVGNMVASQVYTLDIEDQTKVLGIKFYYKLASGTANMSGTSSNSFAMAVWDVTNSVWLPVAGAFNLVQSTGVGIATGTFQTQSTTSQIRFVIYNVTATSGAVSLYLDDISVGPQISASAPSMNDYVAFTPVFTNITTTGTAGIYKRVGDSIEVIVASTTSGAASGTITISLPPGLNPNLSILPSAFAPLGVAWGQTGSSNYTGTVILNSAAVVAIEGPSTGPWNATNPTSWSGTSSILLHYSVPIAGFSSNAVMSTDTDSRVLSTKVTGIPTGTLTTSYNKATFPTITYDLPGAYSTSTGVYTVPVSGIYEVKGQIAVNGTFASNTLTAASLFKNGTQFEIADFRVLAAVTATVYVPFTFSIQASAGDQLDLRVYTDGTTPTYGGASNNWAIINRLSGPAVVMASETVAMSYDYGSADSVSNSVYTTLVGYTTKQVDTHNAYNAATGTFTVPVSGTYSISGSVGFPATTTNTVQYNSRWNLTGSKVGVRFGDIFNTVSTSSTYPHLRDSFVIKLLAGDTIQLQSIQNSAGAISTSAVAITPNISIYKIGN